MINFAVLVFFSMQLKKVTLFILFVLCIQSPFQAQTIRCGTDASKLSEFFKLQTTLKTPNRSGKEISTFTSDTLVVPVVVHILYNTPEQNLSDEQIKSQIDALNEDFKGVNATTAETPVVWQNMITDSKIRFCLASRTPGANPQNTNGIIRKFTPTTSFASYDDSIKFSALGGADVWAASEYLNVWVCNLQSGILGYSTLPGGNSLVDGIVVHYKSFGRLANTLSRYNYGRTLTHEVGHYFNLVHIWGDDNIGNPCSMDDYVNDTPLQAQANYCCPHYPQYDNCQTNGNGIMFMNYMDYSDDKFMQFYTPGQIERMDSAINNYRSSLFISPGCNLPITYSSDLILEEILLPAVNMIDRCFQPQVRIRNSGTQQANGFTIEYNVLGGNSQKWKINNIFSAGGDTIITLPEIAGKEKVNILEVRIVESDSNTVNNYACRSFYSSKGLVKGCDDTEPLVFPNPLTTNSFCVKSNFIASQHLTIRVLNILGEKISEQMAESNPGDIFTIKLINQPDGVYFLQMIGEENGSRAAKFLYLPSNQTGVSSSFCQ